MSPRLLVLAMLALAACTDRALDDGDTSALASSDLAGRDLRGVDLAGTDFAGPSTGGVDLAVAPQLGVPCGSGLCTPDQICCGLSGTMGSACLPAGGGNNGGGCGFGNAGYRCDGPEDCAGGRRCVGTLMAGAGVAPQQTRCAMNAGMGGVIVCHFDGDCRMAEHCIPTMQPQSGAPMISVCQ